MSHSFDRHPFPVLIYCTVGAASFHALNRTHGKTFRFHRYLGAMMEIDRAVAVVALSTAVRRLEPHNLAGVLAHEATHVVQWAMRVAAEHTPGDETEAYMVQAMVEWMWKIIVDGRVN